MEERNPQYELQTSRNGLPVPVINGIYLHSIYNPVKEAQAFIQNFTQALQVKNTVLILGLGFGYHIDEAVKVLEAHHKNFNIFVLEPNKDLVSDYFEKNEVVDERIKIVTKADSSELFNSWEFVQFLMKKPCIIKHDASFTLEKEYYTNFLAHQASKRTSDFTELLYPKAANRLNESTERLAQTHQTETVGDLITGIKDTGRLASKSDYFLMAFNEIVNSEFQGK